MRISIHRPRSCHSWRLAAARSARGQIRHPQAPAWDDPFSALALRVSFAALCLLIWSLSPPFLAAQDTSQLSFAQRRERLENMDAAEKERLLRQKERFDQLSPQEQQQLRDVHQELSRAPDGQQLMGVLQRYCEWLKTLTPVERSELLALRAEQRIARIRALMQAQEEQRLRRLANLSYEEGKAVREWFTELITPHEDNLWELLPATTQAFIESRARDRDDRRRQIIWWLLFRHNQGDKVREYIVPSPDEMRRLLDRLSQERREEFLKLGSEDQKRELVVKWVTGAIAGRTFFHVSEEELQAFFVRELPREKQAELELLPREEMQRELRRLYFAHKFGRQSWGFGGPSRSGPPFSNNFPRRERTDSPDDRSRPDDGKEPPP